MLAEEPGLISRISNHPSYISQADELQSPTMRKAVERKLLEPSVDVNEWYAFALQHLAPVNYNLDLSAIKVCKTQRNYN